MSLLLKKLCEELGFIYEHKKKAWVSKSSHDGPMTSGVIFTSVRCNIDGKEDHESYHLFDGNHDETPWQYTKYMSCLKKLKQKGLLKTASVDVTSREEEDYSIYIRFFKHKHDDENFVEFHIILGKHYQMPLKKLSKTITKTEVKRALTVTRQILQSANITLKPFKPT